MLIDFVSFNVRCCDDPDGNSIEERAPRLKQILEPLYADVVTLQEIRPKWVPEIEKYFSSEYESFLCYRSQEKPEGLITLWKKNRFELLEKNFFWFSDTPHEESMGWDEKYNCPRICSYVLLKEKGSGKTFLVMNTHFGFGEDGQVKSAKLIQTYRNKFRDQNVILAGDFNMLPGSPAHVALLCDFQDANAKTANDRRATYHAYAPSAEQKMHIDFIFCDHRTVPESFRILDECVDGKYPSDHFGIYSRLLL